MTERERFYIIEEQFREDVRRALEPLTDDELNEVYDLFSTKRLIEVPHRYHGLTWKVRAAVKHEQKRRHKEQATNE